MCESDVGPSMKGAGISMSSSNQGRNWVFGYKQCGSSIADVSDRDLPAQTFTGFEGGPFGGDGLVHPPCPSDRSGRLPGRSLFRPREIRGTPAPVFLPEQRLHRVNGLFTNDSRSLQQQYQQDQRPPSAVRFPPVRDLLRAGNQKRPSIAKFPQHLGQPNNFGFSRLESMKGGKSYEMHSLTPFGKHKQQADRAARQNQTGLVTPVSPPTASISNHQRGRTSESDESHNQSLVDSPFLRLIPLNEARKKSAIRSACRKHEDALSSLNAHSVATKHTICNISTASNAGTVITAPSAVATPPVPRFTPRAIASQPARTMFAHDGTGPTISTADNDGSGQIIHTLTYPDGTRSFLFDPEPRLVPWDQRHRRGLAPWSTDRSLQAIQRGQHRGMDRVYCSDNSEHWLSPEADEKRRVFFLCIACFSVFPFIALVALCGGLNTALSWTTHGEVNRFSKRQLSVLMLEATVGIIAWISLIVFGLLKIH